MTIYPYTINPPFSKHIEQHKLDSKNHQSRTVRNFHLGMEAEIFICACVRHIGLYDKWSSAPLWGKPPARVTYKSALLTSAHDAWNVKITYLVLTSMFSIKNSFCVQTFCIYCFLYANFKTFTSHILYSNSKTLAD